MIIKRLKKLTQLTILSAQSHSFSTSKIFPKQTCHKKIQQTVSLANRVASLTFGPYGRNIAIQNTPSPRITKDGITVIKHLQSQLPLQNAILSLIKRSIQGTNRYAGDGTTTSTILIGEIMKQSYKKMAIGGQAGELRKGFEIGKKIGLEFLDGCKREIKNKRQLMGVGLIASNGRKEIAELVVQAVWESTSVKVEKSQKCQNSIEYHSGLNIPQGIETVQYANTNLQKVVYNYPLIVTSQIPINTVKQILGCLQLAKKARKQIVIFAPQFSDSVKSTLIYNNKKKILQCCAISLPNYGDKPKAFLQKVSKQGQSYLFSEFSSQKIQNITWSQMGKALKLQSNKFQTTIEIPSQSQSSQSQPNKNQQATILVGGPTQTVMLESYDLIIDALNSTNSAKKNGVVAGGGLTLYRLGQLLERYSGEGEMGVHVLARAFKQPRLILLQHVPDQYKSQLLNQISPNSRQTQSELSSGWLSFDLNSLSPDNSSQPKLIDFFQAGIVDSVQVARSVIIDSISLCSVLVDVDIAIGVNRSKNKMSEKQMRELSKKYKM